MKTALIILSLCIAALPAQAFTDRVLSCHDGDTCRVDVGQGTIKVRLAEIAAPELDQPYGPRAQRALCDLICAKIVEINDWGLDPYNRTVGLIHAPFDVSEQMVREDMAWVYARYNVDPAMPGIEEKARAGHLGLWSQFEPIPPWDWRHDRAGR
jgi:micrococcal nuclease